MAHLSEIESLRQPGENEQPSGGFEQLGTQNRLLTELSRLETGGWEARILVGFAVAVLALGGLSFFLPRDFWTNHPLTVSFTIPPVALFVVMIALVIFALSLVRRERALRKMRMRNVNQLLEAQSKLSNSMLDSVTHVFNRSLLRDLLQSEISGAERNGRPLALMMTDIDHFKEINDRFGHLTGDFVLAEVANILRSCIRGSDYIVRYGGDEFVLILPETDEEGADMVKRRIYQRVEEWQGKNRMGKFSLNLSIGTHLHKNGETADQTLSLADSNMYEDKRRPRPVAATVNKSR